MTYSIIDLTERNAAAEAHRYTWEQVLDFFRPGDDPELEEDRRRFDDVKDLSDLREFLEWQADGMRVHYQIEETA